MDDTNNNTDPIVIDRIDFEPDLDKLLREMRLKPDSSLVEEFIRLVEEAREVARPRACYRLVFIEEKGEDFVTVEGITLTSRVLRVNLEETHRGFVFVSTCGAEMYAWASEYKDMLHKFWADQLMEKALFAAQQALMKDIEERFSPGKLSSMAPGSLTDWPVTEQPLLFKLLGDTESLVGVRLNDHCLMVPIKSISGLAFPTESGFASCQLCPRRKCPGRRAAYDPELYDRKYRPNP